jgi:hypothetical protein
MMTEDQIKIIDEALKILMTQFPKCGHKGVILCRLEEREGFYWQCHECLAERVVEALVGQKSQP